MQFGKQVILFGLISCGLVANSAAIVSGQQYSFFSEIVGGSTGRIGWDSFSITDPNNYVGPHAPDIIQSNSSGSILRVSPGGFKAGPNLYAFFSTPTWSIAANGLETTNPWTAVGLQVAVTPPETGLDLVASNFALNGLTPDQFVNLGVRTSLNAGGGQPPQPVVYYWAAWNDLTAASNFNLSIGPGGKHAVFTAARVDYVNHNNFGFQISAVPEPTLVPWILLAGSCAAFVRRRVPA